MKYALGIAGLAALMTVNGALAADIAPRQEPVAAPVVRPVYNAFDWTGLHIGIHGGHLWGNHHFDPAFMSGGGTLPSVANSFNSDGYFIGGQAGFDVQFANNVVAGIEADLSYADIDGESSYASTPGSFAGSEIEWIGTVRGRIGYAFDRIMPYATGGIAVAGTRGFAHGLTGPGSYASDRNVSTGWVVGAGVEYALNDYFSLKGEYLFTKFTNGDYFFPAPAGGSLHVNEDASLNVLKVGVNYRFN